jgi:DNA-binding SARP family transcriptional activator/membrane-associated phospholipid phosphatase
MPERAITNNWCQVRINMLRLQLLGGFNAEADTGDVSALVRQPRRAALLTLLAVERELARERVMAMLWPEADPDRGRHSLNQGIYYLRRIIGADWVELRGDRCVVASWVATDVQELEQAAAAGQHSEVLRLYGGALLAGAPLAATAEFDMWVDARRAAIDRLHRRARRDHIGALLAAGQQEAALHCAEEWCRLDPLEDEAQHRVIELLAASGQRAAALQQYGSYQRLLDEYELKPLDDTVLLVEHLQQGETGPLPSALAGSSWRDGAGPIPSASDRGPAAAHRAGTIDGRTAPPGEAAQRAMPRDASRRAAASPQSAPQRGASRLLLTRTGLSALLAGVFAVNLLETTVESWLTPRLPVIAHLRLQSSRAAHWLEGHLSFEYHDLTNDLAVIGFSMSYFFVFPALLVAAGLALAMRASIRPYRVFATAVTINYLVSLPFFLLFPVPERWSYSDSGAMVLSDLWSTDLIDMVRPISGLDNSFPSFHVSLTVVLVLVSFIFRLRFRWSVLFLGGTVVLATFVLGIHWLPDLIAGAAAGVLSVMLAILLDRRLPDTGRTASAGAAAHASVPSPRRPILTTES